MKKKFLKVFGIFAVICLSVITLAGCSIQLDKEQQDKVMTVVDNADQFMYDMLENLKLDNAKMDREEAFKAVQDAQLKLAVNYDNIWSNIRITSNENGSLDHVDEIIQAEDGVHVMLSTHFNNEGEINIYNVNYSKAIANPCVIDYTQWVNESGQVASQDAKTKEGYPFSYYLNMFNYIQSCSLTAENVLSCEVLEDGSTRIAFIYEVVIHSTDTFTDISCGARIVYELKDGLISKVSSYSGTLIFSDEPSKENPELLEQTWPNNYLEYVIEYGSADANKVETKYAQAKLYAETNLPQE